MLRISTFQLDCLECLKKDSIGVELRASSRSLLEEFVTILINVLKKYIFNRRSLKSLFEPKRYLKSLISPVNPSSEA